MAADTVTWAGLDYSLAEFTGTEDLSVPFNFTTPNTIFPGMLEKWNELFLEERVEQVSTTLRKQVQVDIGGVTARNKMASKKQIVLTSETGGFIEKPHISQQEIADEVRSYKTESTNGLGLVFIVDRLVRVFAAPGDLGHGAAIHQIRNSSAGAVYIVFFDLATRDVISAERYVSGVSTGGNFRNFWFGPIKNADASLSKYRSSNSHIHPSQLHR